MNERKRTRSYRKERPKFKIPLTSEWNMVFLSSGRRFYFNSKQKRSVWNPPADLESTISGIDHDQMILLIAKARGLRIGGSTETKRVPDENKDDSELQQTEVFEEEEVKYSDNAASESPDNSDAGTAESESEQDNNGILDGEESESEEDPEAIKESFEAMLDEYQVNPYGVWSTELNKVINDDRYDLYDSGNQRSGAYDNWSKRKISESKAYVKVLDEGEAANDGPDTSEPVVLFLLFIKANYKPKMFYIDFKRKFRKESDFADSDLSDKDKEKLYREFSVLIKKSNEERLALFRHKLSSVHDIYLEPIYYTIDSSVSKDILTEHKGKSSNRRSVNLRERQQQVDAERRELEKDLYHSRKRLGYKNRELAKATYGVDTNNSLRNVLEKK